MFKDKLEDEDYDNDDYVYPVRVKDLVSYLLTLDQEATVGLDREGWLEQHCKKYQETKNPIDLIRECGVFWEGKNHLILCN